MLLFKKKHLNLADPVHATFWAVSLVGFSDVLCKANMLLKSVAKFNPSKNLHRSDIAFFPAGWVITVNRRSKTIQFSQRVFTIHYHPFLATRCAPIQLCSMPSSLFLPPCLAQPLSYQHPPARVSFLSRMESSTVL